MSSNTSSWATARLDVTPLDAMVTPGTDKKLVNFFTSFKLKTTKKDDRRVRGGHPIETGS